MLLQIVTKGFICEIENVFDNVRVNVVECDIVEVDVIPRVIVNESE